MNWIEILTKTFWCGWGAVGFGILFNVPARTLMVLWIGGAIGGFVKFSLMGAGVGTGIIAASFAAASIVGIMSIPMAHFKHIPPMIFAIPSVIPLVPGVLAYRTMLGLIKLASTIDVNYNTIVAETLNNGIKTLFIMMSLAVGVAIPMHVMRNESVKNIRLLKKKKA
ncbi:MAG TPA: threonine/serine exporter family protein [Phnomibacter sp.]|nr:threonine/serine exporter family protein [Phnomibacter sp.]